MRNFIIVVLSLLFWSCGSSTPPSGPPYTPELALETLEIEDGFSIDLFASEPLVQDPVAMAINESGQMFVVEMPGYPLDASGSGRIKQLTDTDGDGYPDTATLFADGLILPNGIMPWKKGILVTDPPDVLYYEDTDGDGISDLREVVLTGFALSNPQHNANTPLYGIDNWIYIANNGAISWTEKYADPFGDTGGQIFFPSQPEAVQLPPNGYDRNIRFRPDSFELQMLSGNSQFGHTFDPWGNHFLNDNSHPHYYEAIAARYLEGNLNVAISEATHSSLDHGEDSRVFPITFEPEHQLLTDRGVFTSACGITWYHGGLFPEPYSENITFTAEPVHNLVYVAKVNTEGNVFEASRIVEGREFLASTDAWFRPVNFSVGPDGAMYVVDYYRQVVEHPEWMDDAVVEEGDFHQGSSMGRIYRIVPDGTAPPSWLDAIAPINTQQLVERLSDPNGWWRMTAQRLLVSEADTSAISILQQHLSDQESAEGRLHILWTLHGLGSLSIENIRTALSDPHPGVRENAVRLAEIDSKGSDILEKDLVQLASDPSIRVRYQVLKTLGRMNMTPAESRRAQESILREDIEDQWIQVAALLSMPSERLLTIALSQPNHPDFLEKVSALMVRERKTLELFNRITSVSGADQWWHVPLIQGMASASAIPTASQAAILVKWMWDTDNDQVASAILDLLPRHMFESDDVEYARLLAMDSEASVARRSRATRVLSDTSMDSDALLSLFGQDVPLDVQLEAIKGLQRVGGDDVAEHVLQEWERLTPRLRNAALSVFNNTERVLLLVEALESGVVNPTELPWNHRVTLMRDTDEPIRSRARALLQVFEEVSSGNALDLTGKAESGALIFATTCASCHARGVGPDLATVRHWSEPMLMSAITKPSESISSGYEYWEISTLQGDTLLGVVASETTSAIEILNEHSEHTISRSDILSVKPLAMSGMPEDLIPDSQSLADLVAYLKEL